MPNDAFNNGYIPPATGVAPDSTAFFTAAWMSIRGDTFLSYPDFASMTAAVSAPSSVLSADQKKGVLCHVQSGSQRGLWFYTGSAWIQLPMKGITFNSGTAQGACDPNGIMKVDHGLASAPTNVQVTMEGDASQVKYLRPVVVLIDSTRILIKFWYNDPAGGALQVNAGGYTSFHWRAEL